MAATSALANRPARWNAFDTGMPIASKTKIVQIPTDDGPIHAYLAQPDEAEPRPGVVLLHHVFGWDEFYWEATERLARHGYDVICPDLYCRFGHGEPRAVADSVADDGGVHDDSVVRDCTAAAELLRSLDTNDGRVAIMGACSGGRHALLTASRTPGWSAVVDFWGGRVVHKPEEVIPARPVAPIEYTEGLVAPLLGVFGMEDVNPSLEDVAIHEAELRRLGKDFEFHRLAGAGHGFFHYHQARYRAEPALAAWDLALAFLAERMPPASTGASSEPLDR